MLSAVIHRDETTPHLQFLVIPLDARGKLNARELVGGKATLSKMQTDFACEVGQDFGLERGLERGRERSQARHQTIKEYYARANAPVEADFRLPERQTRIFAHQLGLKPCFTPVKSPQSNGISEAFVKTLKRDYVHVTPLPDAATVLELIAG